MSDDLAPLEDFRRLLSQLPERPHVEGSGGVFERLARQLATVRGKGAFRQPTVALFVGAHGVARHGVSVETAEDIRAAMDALERGDAPLNGVASTSNLSLKVFDLALDLPTGDITETVALSPREAAATIAFGMEALAGGTDLLILASLGRGGETAAEAVCAALGGGGAAWTESCAVPMHVRLRRAEAVGRALSLHRERLSDPLAVLSALGGREIAAMAGAIVAAGTQNVPVILDGEAAAAAALAVTAARPGAAAHCVLADRLPVQAMAEAAAAAGLEPILDLGLWRGDGVAGALAAGILKAALATA